MSSKDYRFYTGCVDCPAGGKNETEANADKFVKQHEAKGHRAYSGLQLHDPKKKR